MPAYVTSSSAYDSTLKIVRDLTQGVAISDPRHAVGLLLCDSEVDGAGISGILYERLGLTCIGGSSLQLPFHGQLPYDECSATLLVLERDKLCFSVAVSEELEEPLGAALMAHLYRRCLAGLDEEPRLLIPWIPVIPGLDGEPFIGPLIKLADGVPLFGGVITDDLEKGQSLVYVNGEAYTDRILLLALGGDLQPVFALDGGMSIMTEYAPRVTSSEGCVVYTVDDIPVCDYLAGLGISPGSHQFGMEGLMQYVPMPVQLGGRTPDDGVPEITVILSTNPGDGSAFFARPLPVGTRINAGMVHRADVIDSAQRCVDTLLARMHSHEQAGYRYSCVLAVGCIARYFPLLGDENAEAKLLRESLPDSLSLSGYYSFCEIGPGCGRNDKPVNRSNHAMLVLCAI